MVLPTPAAAELAELLGDEPGHADEDLLDDARVALANAVGTVGPDDERDIGRGTMVAVELTPAERDLAVRLIDTDTDTDEQASRRLAQRLAQKVSAARKRRS